MSFPVKDELAQLAPLLSGIRVFQVPPSVPVVGFFLECFVNPDNSGLKLLEANVYGFDVVALNGSGAVESLGSVVKASGSVAAASVFSVGNEIIRALSLVWYIFAGLLKSSLRLCLVLLPGVSSATGPAQSVCNCDLSFQPLRDIFSDFGFLLVASFFGAAAMDPGDWKFFQAAAAFRSAIVTDFVRDFRGTGHVDSAKNPFPKVSLLGLLVSSLLEWSSGFSGYFLRVLRKASMALSCGCCVGDREVGVPPGVSVHALQAKATARVDVPETPTLDDFGMEHDEQKTTVFPVLLRTFTGKHWVLSCSSDMSFVELISLIEHKSGIPSSKFLLIKEGKILGGSAPPFCHWDRS